MPRTRPPVDSDALAAWVSGEAGTHPSYEYYQRTLNAGAEDLLADPHADVHAAIDAAIALNRYIAAAGAAGAANLVLAERRAAYVAAVTSASEAAIAASAIKEEGRAVADGHKALAYANAYAAAAAFAAATDAATSARIEADEAGKAAVEAKRKANIYLEAAAGSRKAAARD